MRQLACTAAVVGARKGVVVSVQLLAILVTDLVGSTATRVEVGEDRAEVLRREHDAMVRSVVEATDGAVVKSTGDGVLAWFPSAADAVAAAIGVQRRLEGLRVRSPDGAWAMRVGVSVGDVTVEGGDVFGAPVVEASRLCAVAASGEILAVDMVQVMARGRAGDVFVPRGELTLKGLPEPVRACAVRWDSTRTRGAAAVDDYGEERRRAGRPQDELARLSAAWDQALDGRVNDRARERRARYRQDATGFGVREGAPRRRRGGAGGPLRRRARRSVRAVRRGVGTPRCHNTRARAAQPARYVSRARWLGSFPTCPNSSPTSKRRSALDPEIERAEFVDAVIRWLSAWLCRRPWC